MKKFIALAVLAVSLNGQALAQSALQPGSAGLDLDIEQTVTVYKSPTCSCCTKWIEHLQANGFKVETIKIDDLAQIKTEFGVPGKLGSCHTAIVDDYFVEGHVHAQLIKGMLRAKPELKGIAVPGMPMGSPGMEMPGYDGPPYSVVGVDLEGRSRQITTIDP